MCVRSLVTEQSWEIQTVKGESLFSLRTVQGWVGLKRLLVLMINIFHAALVIVQHQKLLQNPTNKTWTFYDPFDGRSLVLYHSRCFHNVSLEIRPKPQKKYNVAYFYD